MSGHDDIDDGILRSSEERIARQVALIAGLVGRHDTRIVDLGCGEGAHVQQLLALGYRNVCGIDSDAASLAKASQRVPGADWRLGDAYEHMPSCDLAFAFFGSFGCGPRRDVVGDARRARAQIAPGGSLVLDVVNRDFYMRRTSRYRWLSDGTTTITEECDLHHGTGDLTTARVYRSVAGTQSFRYIQRSFVESEIRLLLAVIGFDEVQVTANELGDPTGTDRQRLVVVAR